MRVSRLWKGSALALAIVSAGIMAQTMAGAQAAGGPPPGAPEGAPPGAPPGLPGGMPPGMAASYLKPGDLPDSAVLLPAPPAKGSQAMQRDEAGASAAIAQRGTPRWTLAISDAQMSPDAVGSAFSCAAGIPIGPKTTPLLAKLLQRASADMAMSSGAAKRKYQRPRPFMENGAPTCTPDAEAGLRRDGSYPSGHSTIGFGTGLILAEVIPSRATQVLARGRAYGDSRRICNAHWASDIEEGRFMAAATFARLNAESAFQADLAAAREEAARVMSSGIAAGSDCAAQAAALAATS